MRAATSGMTLKMFLQAEGVAYSTNYWCRKMKAESETLPIAPISIRSESHSTSVSGTVTGVGVPGVMVAFPNGVRVHSEDPATRLRRLRAERTTYHV